MGPFDGPAGLCALGFFLGRPTGRLPRGRPEASARAAAAAVASDAVLAALSGSGGRPRFLGTGAASWSARAGEAVAAAAAGLLAAAAAAAGAAGGAIGFLRGLPRFLGSGAGIAGGAAGLLTGLLATAETGVSDLRGRPRFWPGTTCAVGVPTGIATLGLLLLPGGRPRGRLGVCSPALWAASSPGTDIVGIARDAITTAEGNRK